MSDERLRSDDAAPRSTAATPSDAQEMGAEVAASNLGPIIWTVGASFDRRADMLFENTPCDTLSMVMATVLDACKRDATEIKVRCWPTYKWRMDGEEQEGTRCETTEAKPSTQELARAENARGSVGETPADALLASCPFDCDNHGGLVIFDSVEDGHQVFCNACNCRGPAADTKQAASAAWNRRALLAPKAEGRDDVLEEAAKVVEARKPPTSNMWDAYSWAMDATAAAIRALKGKPHACP